MNGPTVIPEEIPPRSFKGPAGGTPTAEEQAPKAPANRAGRRKATPGRRADGTTGSQQPIIRRARRRHGRNALAKASRKANR